MKSTVLSALVVTFSLVGDTLLYPVLPSYAFVLGVPVIWIGFLLSVNRFTRLLLNPWVGKLYRRHNSRSLMVLAAILAVLSTMLYGLANHIVFWIVARLIWAVSFSMLRLGSIYYALDSKKKGLSLGLNKGIQESGPLLAMIVGPFCLQYISVQTTFLVFALLTTLAVFVAMLLPVLTVSSATKGSPFRLKPSSFNTLIFLVAFSVDGLLVVIVGKLLDSGQSLPEIAALAAFYLMIRRLVVIGLSPVTGLLADRLGIRQVFLGAVFVTAAGFAFLMVGFVIPALLLIFVAAGAAMSLAPAGSSGEPDQLFHNVAVTTNWRDGGAAFGALIGGMLYHTQLIHPVLILLLTGLLLAAFQYGLTTKTVTFKSIRWK
jgi:DHA1 family multidrug resistance protein-like MFS transporter